MSADEQWDGRPPMSPKDFVRMMKEVLASRSASPLHDLAMNALVASRDPRVMAVRRKASIDQLRAIVDCFCKACFDLREEKQTALASPAKGDE